jgi:hypothetical protein
MNDKLRRENEALRSQLYGSSSSSHAMLSAPIMAPHDGRSYLLALSFNIADFFTRGGSPPSSIGSDMMPMTALPLTSSMINSSMQAYADPSALSSQPYSMVHQSGALS